METDCSGNLSPLAVTVLEFCFSISVSNLALLEEECCKRAFRMLIAFGNKLVRNHYISFSLQLGLLIPPRCLIEVGPCKKGDLTFAQQYCVRFKSSWLVRRGASGSTVLELLGPEDKGTSFLRGVGNYLQVSTGLHLGRHKCQICQTFYEP